MYKIQIAEFISEVRLFGSLNTDEIELLSTKFEEKKFKKGDILFKEGSSREFIFVIFEGEIELFKRTPFGEEKRLSFFRKYDFMGEGSLMDNSPHSTTGRAMTDVNVLVLGKDTLLELLISFILKVDF